MSSTASRCALGAQQRGSWCGGVVEAACLGLLATLVTARAVEAAAAVSTLRPYTEQHGEWLLPDEKRQVKSSTGVPPKCLDRAWRIIRDLHLKFPDNESLVSRNHTVREAERDINTDYKLDYLLEWLKVCRRKQLLTEGDALNNVKTDNASDLRKSRLEDCVADLLLVITRLCNDTENCVSLTETSMVELLHRFLVWERKMQQRAQDHDAVIYIVVVLAFYSFGIVFMMANFVRQEQRELEETKMYKQYVKMARDRWLTTRGNITNRLALQALNTLNAVPQTTDVNKVTFV